MKKARVISYSLLAVALVSVIGRSTRSYSAICVACLQKVSGVEKSVSGITLSSTEKHLPHAGSAYDSVTNQRVIAPLDPKLYQEITGHRCEHTFVRSMHLPDHGFRKELVENLYRGYLRVPDQALARETISMIDRHYPLSIAKASAPHGIRPPIQYTLQIESFPNQPLSILYRGLAVISNSAEWRQVLDAANAGDGSLKLLVDPAALARSLGNPDPEIRLQLIDQLAALKDPDAWVTISNCLKDPHTWEHAASRIVYNGQSQYFEAVFEAYEQARYKEHYKEDDPIGYTPQIFDHLLAKYSAEEIRELLIQNRSYLDRLAFAAIRRQQRFEFLDEVLAVLNERPTAFAERAIESLLQGPTPFEVGMHFNDLPRKDPWAKLVAHTNMNPVESMTNFTDSGKRAILNRQQIVRLGLQQDPARWSELCDLYISSIPLLGDRLTSAAIAQAMAESDRAKTLDFLLSQLDLDYSRKEQTVAAIAGLGAIADPGSLAPLLAFLKTGAGTLFEGHSYYQREIAYALHRCRGSQRWRLVKNPNSSYSIEKH